MGPPRWLLKPCLLPAAISDLTVLPFAAAGVSHVAAGPFHGSQTGLKTGAYVARIYVVPVRDGMR